MRLTKTATGRERTATAEQTHRALICMREPRARLLKKKKKIETVLLQEKQSKKVYNVSSLPVFSSVTSLFDEFPYITKGMTFPIKCVAARTTAVLWVQVPEYRPW